MIEADPQPGPQGAFPSALEVGQCHSDMGIPAFWASLFPYP